MSSGQRGEQGKAESLSSNGSQERSGYHYPKQPWGSVRKEVDAPSEEGDVRVRRECMKSMDDDMGCSIKRLG